MTDKPSRIALVTGANRGIGFEVCGQLASQGFVVLLTARNAPKAERAVRNIGNVGTVEPLVLDVSTSWGQRGPAKEDRNLKPYAMQKAAAGKEKDQKRIKDMEIKRAGSQPSAKGPSEWFTGNVRIDPLFQAPDPALVQGASVTFEPGARTAWHIHPLGQTLIVTAGCGWVQREGGPIEEIRPGDVVWFSPGEKHWHGATSTTGMTHIAIQEKLNGKVVDWMEHVSDEQYRSR